MEYDVLEGCSDMDWSSWMIGNRAWESVRLWHTMQGNVMQLHSVNDQMTARVNMPFPCLYKYDSLQHVAQCQRLEEPSSCQRNLDALGEFGSDWGSIIHQKMEITCPSLVPFRDADRGFSRKL